jgi:tetratricopeptide (TPR) repeat protein
VDDFTSNLKPGQKVPEINIRAFGTAIVDCTMIREELVVKEVTAQAGTEAVAQSGDTAPREDPFVTALRMAGNGDLEGSVEFFEKAFKKEDAAGDPEKLEAYARVLYQLGRYDQAEARANEAIAADPELASPHLILYTVHVSRKDYDAAGSDLNRAADLDPGDRKIWEQKAWLAEETGRNEDAVAAYTRMTELNPADVQSWLSLGGLHAKMGNNDLSQQAYQKVVELDPKNAYQTFFNIGALIEQDKNATDQDVRKAIDAYRKAVEIKPDYSQAYKRLGYILLRVGDLKGCRQALEKYVELEPNAADAAQIKGMVSSLPQ